MKIIRLAYFSLPLVLALAPMAHAQFGSGIVYGPHTKCP